MAANLTARQLRVFIGGDGQEWSFAARDFVPDFESVGENGIAKTFAKITILELLSGPESINPRANPARWREGQVVRVDVATDGGGWFTFGRLRLLTIPSGPTSGAITLDLGCALAWADDPQPEGDRTAVTTGVGENSAAVAARLLVASGIPEGDIDLGVWEFDLPYPMQKEGNGSYIAQAGALAFANHCRVLYQDPSGIIRSEQWSAAAGTPAAVLTAEQTALFEPSPDPVPPAERVLVSGVGYQPVTTPGRYSDSFTVTEPASNFSDSAAGSASFTTTTINSWGETEFYLFTREEVRLTQPAILVFKGATDVFGLTTVVQTVEKRYRLNTKILYQVIERERANVKAIIPNGEAGGRSFSGTTTLRETITDLTTDAAAETLTRRISTTTEPRIVVEGRVLDGISPTAQTPTRITDTLWSEDRPDYWVERTAERVAAGTNPNGRGGKIKPTALTTQRPQVKGDSRPPATERWPEPTSLKEQHYEGLCLWQHPGGATGRQRTRPITVTPAFDNRQCFEIAHREVQLLEGRREAHLIELPLSDALLWVRPLAAITVDDGSNLWTFRLDAAAWVYGVDQARLVCQGIVVARVPSPVPVGTPLPAFVSGEVPGQMPAPEPPAFEVPQDLVIDVEVSLSAAPASISATAIAKQGVTAALSAAPATLSAETVATQTAAVALTAAPANIAAAVQLRGAVSAALSAAPASLAATTVATPVVAVALSAAPATISAAVQLAVIFEPETNALLAALTGTYNSARQEAINTKILALKNAGVWAKYDQICVTGLNIADSLINWKSPGTFNANLVGSPAFTADRGFTGSAGNYINSNLNPVSAAGNYSQNSAHLAVYSRTDVNSDGFEIGAQLNGTTQRSGIRLSRASSPTGRGEWVVNSNSLSTTVGVTGNLGLYLATRTASGVFDSTKFYGGSGALLGSTATVSNTLLNQPFYVLAINNNGTPANQSNRQIAAWSIGAGITDTEAADYRAALETYLDFIGAGVV